MAEKTIAGVTVQVTEDGFFTEMNQWTKEMAYEMAREYDIELTEKHFEILNYIRERFAAGEQLTLRKVGTSGIADIKELYKLFPKGPLKLASMFAGIPKPTSCV